MTIGQCNLNLADFKNPNKYNKTFTLSNDMRSNSQASVTLEINTANVEAKTKRGSILYQQSSQSNQEIQKNDKEIEHLKIETKDTREKMVSVMKEILTHHIQDKKEKEAKASLVDMTNKDAILNNTGDMDKKEFYKSKGMDEESIAQLMGMDLEILRLFEIQLKKNTKNDEMLANKINTLNQRPNLRMFLFKKVSSDELSKELMEVDDEIDAQFRF